MFLLKARHGYREGQQFESNVNLSIDTGGVLMVPNKMAMEEFLEDVEMRYVTPAQPHAPNDSET